jgi:hypothetical protein
MNHTVTYGPVNKPAELPRLEFPGRTLSLLPSRTFLNHPARLSVLVISYPSSQKIELPFGVSRHTAPTLLVAVYRFDRGPEQLGHLGLRLVQFFAELSKFFAFQKNASLASLLACPSSVVRPPQYSATEDGSEHRGLS